MASPTPYFNKRDTLRHAENSNVLRELQKMKATRLLQMYITELQTAISINVLMPVQTIITRKLLV